MRHVTPPRAEARAVTRPKFCITEMSMFALLALAGGLAILLWMMIVAVI